MQHKADKKLVQRMLKGDNRAFDAFYEAYFPRVYRFCVVRLPNEHSTQDIVQLTLSNAMRAMHTYRGEASLLTWLCQIARNEVAKWYAANQEEAKRSQSLDQDDVLRAAIESLPATIEGGELQQDGNNEAVKWLVQTALDQLPTAYGDVLELKYIEGLSVAEIAERLATGETAIQSLLARARKAFKEAFSDVQQQWLAST